MLDNSGHFGHSERVGYQEELELASYGSNDVRDEPGVAAEVGLVGMGFLPPWLGFVGVAIAAVVVVARRILRRA